MKQSNKKPVIALTLGDPAGIGPELIARLLARSETLAQANVVLVGDAWLWEDGQRIAGVRIGCDPVADFEAVRQRSDTSGAAFLPVDTCQPRRCTAHGPRRPAARRSWLSGSMPRRGAAANRRASVSRPLNKYAMKTGR